MNMLVKRKFRSAMALALALVMSASVMTGCTGKGGGEKPTTSVTQSQDDGKNGDKSTEKNSGESSYAGGKSAESKAGVHNGKMGLRERRTDSDRSLKQKDSQKDGAKKDRTEKDSSKKNSVKKDRTEKDSSKKNSVKKDRTEKDSSKKNSLKKDRTEKDSSKKNSLKKDRTEKDSSKKNSVKKDRTEKDSTKKDVVKKNGQKYTNRKKSTFDKNFGNKKRNPKDSAAKKDAASDIVRGQQGKQPKN